MQTHSLASFHEKLGLLNNQVVVSSRSFISTTFIYFNFHLNGCRPNENSVRCQRENLIISGPIGNIGKEFLQFSFGNAQGNSFKVFTNESSFFFLRKLSTQFYFKCSTSRKKAANVNAFSQKHFNLF